MYDTPDLDRSPSLSSNSSRASSSGTQPPITPALPAVPTFPSPSKASFASEAGTPVSKSPFPRSLSPTKTPTSPWSAGHRTGAGSHSFDAARAAFANLDQGGRAPSPVLRTTPFGDSSNRHPSSPSSLRGGSPVRDGAHSPTHPGSPVRLGTPGSPTRARFGSTSQRPPLPSIPSDRPSFSPSPSANTSPFLSGSGSPSLSSSASARVLSSSIFSTRDGAGGAAGLERGGVGSVRRFEKGHRRAMTLPHLGTDGLPLPGGDAELVKAVGGLTVEEDVPGAPEVWLAQSNRTLIAALIHRSPRSRTALPPCRNRVAPRPVSLCRLQLVARRPQPHGRRQIQAPARPLLPARPR